MASSRKSRALDNLTKAVIGGVQYNKKPGTSISQLSGEAVQGLAASGNATVALPAQRELQTRLGKGGSMERLSGYPKRKKR